MDNAAPAKPAFNRKNPLLARIPLRKLLTENCGEKETWHFEVNLQDSGLAYEPGDSLAVLPQNWPEQVDDTLAALGFSGDEPVTAPDKETHPLRETLTNLCAITAPDKKFLNKIIEKAGDDAAEIAALLDPDKQKELSDYLWGREIIDILLMFPDLKWEPQEFVDILKKLNVRLYSIASSLKAKPNECHLTVASVLYHSHGRDRKGVCSTWLADRITPDTPIPCFISPGKGFRLPEPEDNTPVIMCGPGTGIAPFRAFLQERQATQAKGDAWLFFGEIHEESCFFYQDEWETYLQDGTLKKLTTAWSRDQDHKIYVHHRMKDEAATMWEWLEKGAIFYVCGDAERMAPDVDRAIHEIIIEQGGKTEEQAAEYVEQMKKDKRYRRDVY
ncbi:MAG: sulfite reductase subunit alpha [Verrucomicrobiota bacterium]